MDLETDTIPVRFTIADYVVFALLLVVSVAIGVYSSLKGKGASSTQAYLLGGRNMSIIPVTFSLTGGVISAISVLGLPTEIYMYGTQLVMTIFGCALSMIFIRNIFIPVIYPLQLVSLFQYIELRFDSRPLRKLATSCQLLSCFFYIGIVLYTPSLALSSVTSLPTSASIVIMGIICTFYITIGGVKAVVYTDVVQMLIMFVGVLAVVIITCQDLGGIAEVWEISDRGGRLEFFNLETSPYIRHTLLSTVVMGAFMMSTWFAISQSQYQRCASVPTLAQAQLLPVLFMLGLTLLWGLFYFSGLVAYATYSECDPLTSGKIEKADQVIPYMVTDKLGHITGLSGLFVASVYGAVLSTLSSQGNAIACVVWEDFLKDLPFFRGMSDRSATNFIKLLSSLTGLLAIGVGLLAGKLGTVFYGASLIGSAIAGPLCGLFFVAMCAPWVDKKGATVGLVFSFLVNCWLVMGRFFISGKTLKHLPLSTTGCHNFNETFSILTNSTSTTATPTDDDEYIIYDISYCYIGIIGLAINLLTASIVSCFTGPNLPGDIEERLIYAPCSRLYRKLYILFGGKLSEETDTEGKEAAVDMLSMPY